MTRHAPLQLIAPHRRLVLSFECVFVIEAGPFDAECHLLNDVLLVVKRGSRQLKPRLLVRLDALLVDDDVNDAVAEAEVRPRWVTAFPATHARGKRRASARLPLLPKGRTTRRLIFQCVHPPGAAARACMATGD